MKLSQAISENLRILRKQKDLSQDALATKSELSRQTVNRYEAGNAQITGETIERLAVALEVEETDLTSDPQQAAVGEFEINILRASLRDPERMKSLVANSETNDEFKALLGPAVKQLAKYFVDSKPSAAAIIAEPASETSQASNHDLARVAAALETEAGHMLIMDVVKQVEKSQKKASKRSSESA